MSEKEGIIYVEVPHQLPVKAYGFNNDAEFTKWMLRHCVPNGFSYTTHDRASWDATCAGNEGDAEWLAKWYQPGVELFDKGAEEIVEVWYDETNRDLFDAKNAPTELECALEAVDDFHAHYVLGRERALEVIAGGGNISHHQSISVRIKVRQEAEQLGWIEPQPENESED